MATSARKSTQEVNATPAKRFFVEMLTRDIELEDAILDLVDNCVDGALRVNSGKTKKPSPDKMYQGFWAHITLDGESFSITDNCGGIPPSVAKDYAFRFGRPRKDIDENIATVGVYGIGMKRALFKMGRDSRVYSHHADGSFNVHITKAWLANDSAWHLPMHEGAGNDLPHKGVKLVVKDLHPAIAGLFDDQSGGTSKNLISKIAHHYAYIIQKGFKVTVNGQVVKANIIQTLFSRPSARESGIAPYLYQTEYDGVKVNLVMGMYAPFPTESEVDDLYEGRRSKDTAGWTVICNDRVVLSHDTTHRTGWGEAGVPAYHSQFVMLAGIVEFVSSDASKLPITTTKRGVNLDSELYASVKDFMREALKHFTAFTYHWKTATDERSQLQQRADVMDIRAVSAQVNPKAWVNVNKSLKGKKFVPDLPKPKREKTHSRITFERSKSDIEAVAEYMEMSPSSKASDVGALAFDWVLEQAK